MILQKPKEYFKKLKEDLNKLKRYQLFNDINEEDYYKPIKTGGDFNDNILIMKVQEIKIIIYLQKNILI